MFVNPTNHPIFIPIAINRRGAFVSNTIPPPLFSLPSYISHRNHRSLIFQRIKKILEKFPNEIKVYRFLETKLVSSPAFVSPNHFKKTDNPIIWPREESCSGRYSLDLTKKRKRKKGGGEGKSWNFYSVSQRNGQFMKKEGRGEWDRLNFARRGKLVFCRCSPHNRPPQNGRGNVEMKLTAGTVSGWPAIGSRFRFGPKLFAPTGRYASLIARAR